MNSSSSKPSFSAYLKKLDPVPTLFLFLTPIVGVLLTIWYFKTETWSWWLLTLFVVFYSLTAMSITGGYHRLFSHKAYEAHFVVRLFYALFGAAAFQNSLLKWCTDHRIHHRFVDSDEDPYSISRGFWYAHMGWMVLKEPTHPQHASFQRDLLRDPVVVWQDKYYLPIAIFMGFIIPGLLGEWLAGSFLGGVAIPGFLRIVALHHSTFLINSASHIWGKQTYNEGNSARDNFITALLTFGEGYHNFHHLFANDYRNGIRWYHWDPTKWAIALKAYVGLAYNLKKAPEDQILRARLEMQEKTAARKMIKLKIAPSEKWQTSLIAIKSKLIENQQKIQALKVEYQRIKAEKSHNYLQQIAEIKAEWKRLKQEWLEAYSQWKELLRAPAYAFA